jgi:hypothetical protein
MSQTYCLDPVIREVSSDEKQLAASQKVIVIDIESSKIVDNTAWRRWKGGLKYYAVTADGVTSAECRLAVFALTEFPNDLTVTLTGAYRVSCERNKEKEVALALHGTSHPGLVLEGLISQWVRDYASKDLPEFIREFLSDRNLIRRHVKEKAAEKGLILDIRLELVPAKHLDTITIGPKDIPLRVGKSAGEQKLTINLHLDVEEENLAAAILSFNRQHSIKDAVMSQVKQYFATKVSLHEFLTNLSSNAVKEGLISALNTFLHQYGRKVGALTIGTSVPPPPKNYRDEIEVAVNVQNYGVVVITNTVELSLLDSELYQDTGSKNLRTWLEETLENVISKELFYQKYVNLLVDFSKIEKKIRTRVADQANAIGYQIDHLVSMPDLEPIRWSKGFSVKPEREFQTKDPMVSAKLQIAISARIPDLRKISNKLNQDVPRLVEEAVVNRVALFLRGIEAQRYYMRFSNSDDPNEESVAAALVREIRDALEEYALEIFELNPLPLDTEITLRLKQLMKQHCQFEVTLTPYQSPQQVVITGALMVEGVDPDGWHSFKLRDFTLADIGSRVEDHLTARLNALPSEELIYMTQSGHEALRSLIQKETDSFVKDAYGLRIKLLTIGRGKTPIEVSRDDVVNNQISAVVEAFKAVDDERVARLSALLAKRTALATAENVEREIKDIDGQITALMNSIQKAPGAGVPPLVLAIGAGQASEKVEAAARPEAPEELK